MIDWIKRRIKHLLILKFNLGFSDLRAHYVRKTFSKDMHTEFGFTKIKLNAEEVFLREKSSDFDVFYQIFVEKEYLFLVELIKRFSNQKKHTFVDVGANIGLTSIFMINSGIIDHVVAIEPDLHNFNFLKKNIGNNKNVVTTINKALWVNDSGLVFDRFRDGREWSISVKEPGYNQKIEVESISINNLVSVLSDYKNVVLKMDIEGAELKMFEEKNQLKELLSVVKYFAIELHDEVVSRIDFTDFISELGYIVYAKGETLYGINKNLL